MRVIEVRESEPPFNSGVYMRKTALCVVLLFSHMAFGQLEINKKLIGHSGQQSTSDSYELAANITQGVSNQNMISASYALQTGFWQENTDLIFKNDLE